MKISLLKNLLNRRVPQILGVYLGGSIATVEFVDWALIGQCIIA